jgi:hypothetical protein
LRLGGGDPAGGDVTRGGSHEHHRKTVDPFWGSWGRAAHRVRPSTAARAWPVETAAVARARGRGGRIVDRGARYRQRDALGGGVDPWPGAVGNGEARGGSGGGGKPAVGARTSGHQRRLVGRGGARHPGRGCGGDGGVVPRPEVAVPGVVLAAMESGWRGARGGCTGRRLASRTGAPARRLHGHTSTATTGGLTRQSSTAAPGAAPSRGAR